MGNDDIPVIRLAPGNTGIPFEDLVLLNKLTDGAMDPTHLRALAARAVFDAWRLGREFGLREAARIAKGGA